MPNLQSGLVYRKMEGVPRFDLGTSINVAASIVSTGVLLNTHFCHVVCYRFVHVTTYPSLAIRLLVDRIIGFCTHVVRTHVYVLLF
jgi:hypothetical protein